MTPPETETPTPEQQAAMGTAVGEAAANAATPEEARTKTERAARETADRLKLEITDEQVTAIAEGVVSMMEARGAFDPPPDPVTAPAPPPAPATPTEQDAAAAAAAAAAAQRPQKRTFAQKFLGE